MNKFLLQFFFTRYEQRKKKKYILRAVFRPHNISYYINYTPYDIEFEIKKKKYGKINNKMQFIITSIYACKTFNCQLNNLILI